MRSTVRFSLFLFLSCLPALALGAELQPDKKKPAASAPYVVRLGTLVPEDTFSGLVIKRFSKKLESRSGGRLRVVQYGGGILGDEPEMAAMLKEGKIEAAGLTGYGLGTIDTQIRVLEQPFLHNTYREMEYTFERYGQYFANVFERRGVKLLALVEYGFIDIWSAVPIETLEDGLEKPRWWLWKGDPLAEALVSGLGARHVVSLPVTKVASALQVGRITAVYIPASGLIIMGWYPYVKYVVKVELVGPVSGIAMNLDRWNSLPREIQDIITEEIPGMVDQMRVELHRAERTGAIAMVKRGIKLLPFGEQEKEKMRKRIEAIWYELADKLYPRSLLDQIVSDLEAFRAGKAR